MGNGGAGGHIGAFLQQQQGAEGCGLVEGHYKGFMVAYARKRQGANGGAIDRIWMVLCLKRIDPKHTACLINGKKGDAVCPQHADAKLANPSVVAIVSQLLSTVEI